MSHETSLPRTRELPFDRRDVLCAAGAAALLAAVNSALGRGHVVRGGVQDSSRGSAGVTEPVRAVDLASAWKRAGTVGKPLLVILVPESTQLVWEMQFLFGVLLNAESKEVLADLAMCELACARKGEVCELIGLEPIQGDPPAVLIESQSRPARVHVIAPGKVDEERIRSERTAPEGSRREALLANYEPIWKNAEDYCRAEALARAIRAALIGDSALLERRLSEASERLPRGMLAEVTGLATRSTPAPLDAVERAAAIVRAEAEAYPDLRPKLIFLLAQAASRRWVRIAPPGAYWVSETGCGLQSEMGGVSYLCGMAHVSEDSERFLRFYTQR